MNGPDERNRQQRNRRGGRRDFLEGALFGIAGGSLAAFHPRASHAASDRADGARLTRLAPADAPAADVGYSPGILAEGGRVIFVSGQGPKDRTADMETQIRQTFERIGVVLKEAGASFANVAILRSYFVHLARDLPVYRKVRKEYLVKPYPASTAIGVSELAFPDLEIEIEAVALV